MLSYKNDEKLKKVFVAEVEKHREQDQIIQGTYGQGTNGDWKGCAVGCAVHSLNKINNTSHSTSDHTVYEKELGIPEWLARLEDTIFEGLPAEDSKKWPVQFAKAVPVGVDLNPIKWKFCAFILKENIERVLTLDIKDDLKEQVVSAIRGVLVLHENAVTTGKWDESAESARSAAESAAESARSAARSAMWSAAWSAAESARSAAESARSAAESAAESARSAARSAMWSAAKRNSYQKYAKELLRLLKEAK